MKKSRPTSLQISNFRVAESVRLIFLDQLTHFKDDFLMTPDNNPIKQEEDEQIEVSLTKENAFVRIFDGYRLANADPLVVNLLQYLQTMRDYDELRLEYDKLCSKDEREYYPFNKILLSLIQRKFVDILTEPARQTYIDSFSPKTLYEGIFVLLDMLTFIEEGENSKSTSFIIRNPRAGVQHRMDRPEYELTKYIRKGRTFNEIVEFYESSMVSCISKGEVLGDLVRAYLKPMIKGNLIVYIPKAWNKPALKPNVFVKHPPIPSYKIMPHSFPTSIAMIPTNRCDNFCRHCSAHGGESRGNADEMDFATVCRLLDEMHYNGLKILRITGGEPLVRHDIFEILDYASDKYFGIILYTNGNRIDVDNIDRIEAINGKKEGNFLVHLSMDGGRRGHDWFRGTKGAFDKVINTMQLFYQAGIQYYVEMCAHPRMMDEFEEVAEMIIQSGARALLMHPAIGIGRGKDRISEFNMSFYQIRDFYQKVESFRQKHLEFDLRFNSYEFAGTSYKNKTEIKEHTSGDTDSKKINTVKLESMPRMGHCTAGLDQLTIDPKGNVYACPSWASSGSEPEGNIFENSILQIWSDPKKWCTSRGGWDYGDVAVCSVCSHFSGCELGKLCRIPSLLWFGTLNGPPPSCVLYHQELGISKETIEDFYHKVETTTSKQFQWSNVLKS